MRVLTCIIAGFVTTAAVSSCGGGGSSPLSNAQFVAQANAACSESNAKVEPTASSLDENFESEPEAVTDMLEIIPVVEGLHERLARITPPSDKQAEYARGVHLVGQLVSELDALRRVVTADHATHAPLTVSAIREGIQIQGRMQEAGEKLEAIATNLELIECAKIAKTQMFG